MKGKSTRPEHPDPQRAGGGFAVPVPGGTPAAVPRREEKERRPPVETAQRVVIEDVSPEIDGGRFAVKRTVGETITVTADIFTDGHDLVAAALRWRRAGEDAWEETPMRPLGNDRWTGTFAVGAVGRSLYTIHAWVDRFRSWRDDLAKKSAAGHDVTVDLLAGAELVEQASRRAPGTDRETLLRWAQDLRSPRGRETPEDPGRSLDEELALLMDHYPDRSRATIYEKEIPVTVDREKARFSTWYELFPRSCAVEPGRHGTFRDVEARLPYVASMGFDVLYFPPIHPIGRTHRKGRNNAPAAAPDDVGSPWAIGSSEGGHKDVHPELGPLEDFRRLVAAARDHGLEIALDIAFQCSPDHPYVRERPEWFRIRPDGTIQYAENPPKKYEDIYPFDFESDRRVDLWEELRGVVLFWIGQGVRIFRVDNPHTKPFPFWEWLIGTVKEEHPEVIFLSEAFTRPKVMYRLAKLGFTQSYTYFAWRHSKREITAYLEELTGTAVREYFRPSLWPNTPDILTEQLQIGGRAGFQQRLVLAATLGANYGIYGPAFELCEGRAQAPGKEEYRDSEKYEIRRWDIDRPESLRAFIARVNRIRRENPALQRDDTLRFHPVDNEQLLAYSKATEDLSNIVLAVVNLDPRHTQAGWVDLPLAAYGIDPHRPFQGHDLLSDARFLWQGGRLYVEVRPEESPAHIIRLRRQVRTERDFDYFM
jgi:starch synthase (maltosyl-transferring)